MNAWRAAALGAALFCAALWTGASTIAHAESPAATQEAREVLVMLRLAPDHLRPGSSYGKGYEDRQTSGARLRTARQIAERHQLELVGNGWPMLLLGIDCYVMRAPPGRSVEAVAAELSHDPMVAWSEPLQTYRTPGSSDGAAAVPPMDAPAVTT